MDRDFSKKKRSFTVIEVKTIHEHVKGKENLGGVYKSLTPISAAKKAVTKICKKSKIHGRCTLLITIQETTLGSSKKKYTYKVTRKRVDKIVHHGDTCIMHRYTTTAHKVKG